MLLALLASNVFGAQSQKRRNVTDFEEITAGFVIYEGQYLAPPYVLRWNAEELTLNKLPFQQPQPTRGMRRGPRGRGSGPGQRFNMPPQRAADWCGRKLSENSLLLSWADQPAVFIPPESVQKVFKTLFSDMSLTEKTQDLKEVSSDIVPTAQWERIARQFTKDPDLQLRLEVMQAAYEARMEEERSEAWTSDTLVSSLTVSGFILSVVALGMLLKAKYPNRNTNGASSHRQVITLVALLVTLNVYDLCCTLMAHNVGGLWELNPIANAIMDQSMMVVVYKLGLTIGAALLLIVARHLHIGQLATYWAGVIYTVLILRWINYNSMFIM